MSTNGTTLSLQPIQATEAYREKYPVAYEQSQLPFDHPRPLKVIVAGAGISGLSLAHAVETAQLRNVDLHILEKNAGLGGTWWENRYPGCACDIPSHNYLVREAIHLRRQTAYRILIGNTQTIVHLGAKPKVVILLRVGAGNSRVSQ
jgi:hypothetical protein